MNVPGFIIVTRFGGPSYGFDGTIAVYPHRPVAERVCQSRNTRSMPYQAGPFTVRPVELRDLPDAEHKDTPS